MEKIYKSIILRGIYFVIAIILVVLSVLSFINGVKWIGKTYPGFFVYKNRVVSIIQPISFYVMKNKIRYPSVIVGVNGFEVKTGDDIYRKVMELPNGSLITYRVKRGETVKDVQIQSKTFTKKDFLSIVGALSGIGLAGILFSIILLIMKVKTKASWMFIGMSLSTGGWLALTFDFVSDYLFIEILPALVGMIALFITWLAFYFPEERKFLKEKPWIFFLPIIPACGIGISYRATLLLTEKYLLTDIWVWSYAGLAVLLLVFSIIYSYYYSESLEAKKRAKVILWSSGVPVLTAGIIFTSVVFFDSRIPILCAPIAFLFWVFALGYTIVKHNIFETDAALRRTVVYGIITVTIAASYLLLLSLLGYIMGGHEAFKSPLFTIVFSVFVLFVFIPVRDRIKDFIDKTFYRERYEFEKTLEQAVEAMATIININALLEKLLDSLSSALHLDRAGIMLPSKEGDFVVAASFGELEKFKLTSVNPLIKLIMENKEPVIRNNLSAENSHGEIKSQMEKYGIKVIIPMLYREKLSGLMLLGNKLSGVEYIKDDLKLLKIFGKQAAVAIENARLHEEEKEKERMAQELESARQIQLSLLPREDPAIAGLDISGISIPAKEVGGDYYGYFKLNENLLCIVIADVTGKGMPSALLMSMVRSSMSALIKTNSRPREILTDLNDIICETKGKLPVTLFLAIIDIKNKTIKYSNAGHDYPYLYRKNSDELTFLECRGLPLGCLGDYKFEEREIKVSPDDIIVFYTDGIIEAQNNLREMFGFGRLESTILNHKHRGAKEIRNKILDDTKLFIQDREILDDMTLVIVKIK
jgi:serine phosphatase RsbU (regulator of sigma subunit)